MLSQCFDNKKTWLFTGSKRAAAIQSLLATAVLNELDPAAWLRSNLEKLPTCLNSEIDSLLPLRHSPLLDQLTESTRVGRIRNAR